MELKQYLEAIDSKQERICRLSDEIWGYAETAFSETRSAKALADCLREEGFAVEESICGVETALRRPLEEAGPESAFWESLTPCRD